MFLFAKSFAVKAVLIISAAFLFSCSSESNNGGTSAEGGNSSSSQDDQTDPNRIQKEKTNVVSQWGELKVCNNNICGSKTNSPVQVRGVSFGWSQFVSDDEGGSASFYKAKMVNALADNWKATVVRAALGVNKDDYNSDDYLGKPDINERRIDSVVTAAIKNDIFVIIDWHDHYANENVIRAESFFIKMAEKYGQYDNVIFEIWNEPINDNWTVIKPYANRIIKAIRDAGSDNLVLIGTKGWSSSPDAAAASPVADGNSAYVFHFYANGHKLGDQNWASENGGSKTWKKTVEDARAAGAAVFASEFGTVDSGGDGTHNPTEANKWLDFLDLNNISWCAWWLNHKAETSAMFVDNFNNARIEAATEADLSNPANLKESGKYILNRLQSY